MLSLKNEKPNLIVYLRSKLKPVSAGRKVILRAVPAFLNLSELVF